MAETIHTRYEGAAPLGRPDWAWSAFLYRDGRLVAAASGASREEAVRRAYRLLKES